MIATIRGTLLECQPNLAVIEVGGLGYETHVPLTTSEKLPALGKEIKLHVHASYREDAQTLYGFADRESRDFFRLIIDKVSGIGPRIALNLLGALSLPTLKSAIAAGDVGLLAKAPGLGKKTAERIVVELKDKVLPAASAAPATGSALSAEPTDGAAPAPTGAGGPYQDALAALLTLGYKATDADKAVRQASDALGPEASTEELIRKALGR